MKRSIFPLAILSLSVMLFSCDDGPEYTGPTLTFNNLEKENIAEPNQPFTFELDFLGGTFDIERIEIYQRNSATGNEVTLLDTTFNPLATSFNMNLHTLATGAAGSTDKLTFYTTEGENDAGADLGDIPGSQRIESGVRNLNIFASLLTVTGIDTIWNIQGPNGGAFNFNQLQHVDPNSQTEQIDLLDQTLPNDLYTPNFTSGAGNGTMYVGVSGSSFDFDNATLFETELAYNAGTELSETGSLDNTSIFICKNDHFPNKFVVVRVLEVLTTPPPPTGDDLDYTIIEYKY